MHLRAEFVDVAAADTERSGRSGFDQVAEAVLERQRSLQSAPTDRYFVALSLAEAEGLLS